MFQSPIPSDGPLPKLRRSLSTLWQGFRRLPGVPATIGFVRTSIAKVLGDDAAALNLMADESRYPLEPSFRRASIRAALFVLLPALILMSARAGGWVTSAWLKPLIDGRPFQIAFGHWVCPIILWTVATSLLYLLDKRQRLVNDARVTDLLRRQLLPKAYADSQYSPVSLLPSLEQELRQQNVTEATSCLLLRWTRNALNAPPSTHRGAIEDAILLDERRMHTSFALPRYVVWSIPMWGLIGTVIGISQAVAGFANSMGHPSAEAGDLTSALRQHLSEVTGGLAAAFDATFLALLLSIPIMWLITWLEKAEETHLLQLQDAWRFEIAPHLGGISNSDDAQAPSDGRLLGEELRTLSLQIRALQETMSDVYIPSGPNSPIARS